MKHPFILSVIVSLAICLGCGKNVELRGQVTYSDNNEPLTTGMVILENDHFQSRGLIGKDGTFRIGTLKTTDGLPPGTYRVYITGACMDDPVDGSRPVWPLIESQYTSPTTSELTVAVDRSTRRFDFSVAPDMETRKKLRKAGP